MINNNRWKDVKGCTFDYQGTTITYDIIFSARQSRAITIKGERVVVRLPVGDNELFGHELIKNKAPWVLNALEKCRKRAENRPKSENFKEGTQHLFLGKLYTLKVKKATQNSVVLLNGTIIVNSQNISEKGVKAQLMKWYSNSADKIFADIAAPMVAWFGKRFNRYPTHFENKFVRGYWGQCRSDGLIRLNIELVKADIPSIQFIIAHELCHLIHRNHSKDFYQLLTEIMPDWKARKEQLNRTVRITH